MTFNRFGTIGMLPKSLKKTDKIKIHPFGWIFYVSSEILAVII